MENIKHYSGRKLDNICFPMGGIGAGMVGIEGTGIFASISLRNHPDIYCDPNMFAAVSFEGDSVARIVEGQVPMNHYYGYKVHGWCGPGNGMSDKNYGFARFKNCSFSSKFPFANIALSDENMPCDVKITGYSPFVPASPDESSLPVASVRYTFVNKTDSDKKGVFYFTSLNFMGLPGGERYRAVRPIKNGFVLEQHEFDGKKDTYGAFAVSTSEEACVNADFYRGGWWDTITMRWKTIENMETRNAVASDLRSPGASIEIPFVMPAGGERSITVNFTWYVPESNLHEGGDAPSVTTRETYKPWYSGQYASIEEVTADYLKRHDELYNKTKLFSDTLYKTDLDKEILDAITANLSILKAPTVMRQTDGRFWAWEGCADTYGSCHGSCTHVWNYAQAVCNLFPSLERSLREVEFCEDMNEEGHQQFRSCLPIRENTHDFHAASDGQLGGIMKMYREWRISGDTAWIASHWDKMITSLEFCIRLWDPEELGVLKEPHHNTYDIEFWGADGMCSSFYLGALKSISEIGKALGKDVSRYEDLYTRGREYVETVLWNGEFFIQNQEWKTLKAKFEDFGDPVLIEEGPKYQYGEGCISDGVMGAWLAKECGLGDILDTKKTKKHLLSVYKYNLKKHLYDHSNPQRPGYALGEEGGLLLCTWPNGKMPSLPFVYSNEVWTGIEYQVACHLASFGYYDEALDIVSTVRARYDGERRNPYNEYECGHWYARALASYGLLEAYTGVRYDAVTKTLYANKGNYTVFISTASGYGTVSADGDKISLDVASGEIEVLSTVIR